MRPWRPLPTVLALLCLSHTAPAHADAPQWLGLSVVPGADGGARLLLRRTGAPTVAVCARSATALRLSSNAASTLRARGGSVAARNLGNAREICIQLPAQELPIAAWALKTAVPSAPEPQASETHAAAQSGALTALVQGIPAGPPALAIVGDFDLDDAAKHFRDLRHPAPSTLPTAQPSTVTPTTKAAVLAPPPGLRFIAWKAPPRGTPGRAAMEVAATLLARGLSRGSATRAEPQSAARLILLRIESKASTDTLRRLLAAELTKLQRGARDFATGIALTEATVLEELDDNLGVARSLLDGNDAERKPRSVLRHLRLVSDLSTEATRRAAATTLTLAASAWHSGTEQGKP